METSVAVRVCGICGDQFKVDPSHPRRRYCRECGKNPRKARKHYEIAKNMLNFHLGKADEPKVKTCKQCGKEYATFFGKTFCSKECETQYRKEHATCTNCGKNLISLGIEIKNAGGGARFCCDECKEAYRWKQARGANRISTCIHCKKEFIGKNKKFCSNKCMEQAKAEGWKEEKPSNTTELSCMACKKMFTTSIKSPADYCPECENKIRIAREREKIKKQKEAAMAEKLKRESVSLCYFCKTPYPMCERMKTNFVCFPKGAKVECDKVITCPSFMDKVERKRA